MYVQQRLYLKKPCTSYFTKADAKTKLFETLKIQERISKYVKEDNETPKKVEKYTKKETLRADSQRFCLIASFRASKTALGQRLVYFEEFAFLSMALTAESVLRIFERSFSENLRNWRACC